MKPIEKEMVIAHLYLPGSTACGPVCESQAGCLSTCSCVRHTHDILLLRCLQRPMHAARLHLIRS